MSDLESRFRARPKLGRHGKGLIAALDMGATKIVCLIARRDPASPKEYKLIGVGQQSSRGMKNGAVIDMEGLERAIRLAVEDAERQAGDVISEVYLSMGGGGLTCDRITGDTSIGGEEVTERHVGRLLASVVTQAQTKTREDLHAIPISYSIDGNDGVADPRGMFADRLGVTLNRVSMPSASFKNLILCVQRAHLEVAGIAAAPLVSALSVLVEDEMENGAICIELGGGMTGFSVFQNNSLIAMRSIPVGGNHVTQDIALGLGTTVSAAERIKTLNGSVLRTRNDANEMVQAPRIGDDGRLQAGEVPRAKLVSVIEPRVEELFELVNKELQTINGISVPRRVVLTGGASQLPGIRELAAKKLSMAVRLGRPINEAALGEAYATPGFSTAAGLLDWVTAGLPDAARAGVAAGKSGEAGQKSVVGRALGWLRENF